MKTNIILPESHENIISTVLSNEATCRILLTHLIERGVKISIDPNELTHEECAEVALQVYKELLRRDKGLV